MANGSLNFSVVFQAITQAFNTGVKGAAQNYQQATTSIVSSSETMGKTTKEVAGKLQDVFKAPNAQAAVGAVKALTQELNNTKQGATLTSAEMTSLGKAGRLAAQQLSAELKLAQAELKLLRVNKALPSEIEAAKAKVATMKDEVARAGVTFSQFQTAASSAMRRAAVEADALGNSSKQAGNAIYSMLNIKSSGTVKAEIAAIQQALATFSKNSGAPAAEVARVTAAANAQIASLRASVSSTNPLFDKMAAGIKAVGPAAAVFGGITIGLGTLKEGIESVLAATVRYQATMKQLEFATGSVEQAGKEYEFVLDVVKRLGLDLDSSASGFAKLAAATKGTGLEGEKTRIIFEGVASAAASLNLSASDTQGVILALSQIVSKGKVSMEELRQQLGERLPGAMQIAANSMGVTTAELEKMVESGIDATQFMTVFGPALVQAFGPTAASNLKTLTGQLNLMKTEFNQLLLQLGNGGVGGAAITVMTDLRSVITSIGDSIKNLDPAFVDAIKQIFEQLYGIVKETFVTLVNGVGEAITVVYNLIEGVAEMLLGFGGLEKSADEVSFVTRAIQGLAIVLGTVQDGIKAIDIAFTLASGVVQSFFSAIALGLSAVTFGDLSRELEQLAFTLQDKAQASFEKASQKALEFKSAAVAAADAAIESHTEAGKVVGEAHTAGADKAKKAQEDLGKEAQKTSTIIKLSSAEGKEAVVGMATASQEVVKALQALAKESGITLPAMKFTAEGLAQTMGEVAAKSDDAAKSIGVKLKDAIDKLGAKDFVVLWDNYVKGLEKAGASTDLLDKTTEKFATQAAKLLGGDLTSALGKLSEGFQENVVVLDKLIGSMDKLGKAGADVSVALTSALDGMLAKAKNPTEITTLIKYWEDLGKQGKISGQQMSEGLEAARKKLDEVKPGVNSVNEALRVLGQTANDSATNMRNKYAEAFQVLKESGAATFTQLTQGLKTMFDAANDTKSLKEVARLFQDLGNQGKLASYDVKQGLSDIQNKLDEMKPGINSLAEAFKAFGLTTREEAAALADKYSQAFNVMKNSGQATASELRQAFTAYAQAAIQANGGVVDGFVQAQAAALGLTVKVDETGKVIVEAMSKGANATDSLGMSLERAIDSYGRLGSAAQAAAEQALAAKEKELALTERLMDAKQKEIDLENRRLGRDREGFSTDKNGNRLEMTIPTFISTLSQLKNWGLDEDQARKIANEAFDDRGNQKSLSNYRRNKSEDWTSLLRNAAEAELRKMPLNTPQNNKPNGSGGNNTSGGSGTPSNSTGSGKNTSSGVQAGKTTNVIINDGKNKVGVSVNSSDEGKFLDMLGTARRSA